MNDRRAHSLCVLAGSLDEPIVNLIHAINRCPTLVTTSSCSGRVSILCAPHKIDQGSAVCCAREADAEVLCQRCNVCVKRCGGDKHSAHLRGPAIAQALSNLSLNVHRHRLCIRRRTAGCGDQRWPMVARSACHRHRC